MTFCELFMDAKGNIWAFELKNKIWCQLLIDKMSVQVIPQRKYEISFPPTRVIKIDGDYYACSQRSYQYIKCDFEKIELRTLGKPQAALFGWSDFYVMERGIWYIPSGREGQLVYLDTMTGKYSTDTEFTDILLKYCIDERILTAYTSIWKDCIIGAVYRTNYIYQYNLKDKSMNIHLIKKKRLCSVIFDGRYYWMTQFGDGSVLRWDCTTDNLEEIHIKDDMQSNRPYGSLFFFDVYLIILPSQSRNIVVINRENLMVTCLRIPKEYIGKDSDRQTSLLYTWFINGHTILLPPWKSQDVMFILDTSEMKLVELKMEMNEAAFVKAKFRSKSWVVRENPEERIHDFCTMVKQCKLDIDDSANKKNMNIGKEIYSSLLAEK